MIVIHDIPYIAYRLRWKSFAVEEMNCNSLENICGCMVVLCIAQGHYCYFSGKVSCLSIDPRKPQNLSTLNDLQYKLTFATPIFYLLEYQLV